MGNQVTRYALGNFGTVYKFVGDDAPPDTAPLIEADGTTLTEQGTHYCRRHGISTPNVEALRVRCEQYCANAMVEAVTAQQRNSELVTERANKTKEVSERLRLDWEAQDKAHKKNASK